MGEVPKHGHEQRGKEDADEPLRVKKMGEEPKHGHEQRGKEDAMLGGQRTLPSASLYRVACAVDASTRTMSRSAVSGVE